VAPPRKFFVSEPSPASYDHDTSNDNFHTLQSHAPAPEEVCFLVDCQSIFYDAFKETRNNMITQKLTYKSHPVFL
jgi:hypothetical protein